MKTKFFTLFALLLLIYSFASAQYVRQYDPGPTSNLTFTCIAKAQDGNYFISGLQDTSIYISEVDASGNVIREKLIGIGTNYYRLSSMIVDADGNIVIVGLMRPANNILQGYLLKVSPALSVTLHVFYKNAISADGMAFSDIKDFKTNTANNAYYVTGYTFTTGAAGWNPMLVKIDRNTGAMLNYFTGRGTGVAANTAQNSYASLLLDTAGNAGTPPSIYVSAPLNSGGIPTNRPWLVKHTLATLAYAKSERYLRDITAAQQASLYDIGLAKDNANLLYCWYGSPNVASNNTHTAMGLSKVDANTLAPVWQKRYSLSPAAGSPNLFFALTKVESDAQGYITRGCWNDGVNESGGDIFFIRTDKNGVPQWARQYKNVSNVQSFNSNFIIDGGNIFAVGVRTNNGNKKGVLIMTPLATGSQDTACAKVLTVQTADSTYAKAENMQTLTAGVALVSSYDPINCVTTTSLKPCDGCKNNPPTLPDANFTLNGLLVGNLTTFTLTASAYATTNNSQFIVSQVNPSTLLDMPGTVLSVPSWATGASTVFPFYQGNGTQGTNTTGTFNAGSIYRVRHIVSGYSNCGILKADTVSKVILLAPGLKQQGGGNNNNFMVIDERTAAFLSLLPKLNAGAIPITENGKGASIFPNPANAFVTFNTEAVNAPNVSIKIVNSSGAVMASGSLAGRARSSVDTHSWASGLYMYTISSNGKQVSQGKFVIQH